MKMPFSRLFEKKSVSIRDIDLLGNGQDDIYAILLGTSSAAPKNILPREAYYIAEKNSDLGTAINRIAQEISNLVLVMENQDGDSIYDSELINLLYNPGEGFRKNTFLYDIAESYLLTNEAWIIARGNINRTPLSIMSIRPYNISVVFDQRDGLPMYIETQSERDRRIYTREIIGGKTRYIDKTKLNEIMPIIGATNLSDEWRGRSPLAKLLYDVDMNTEGKRHNVSMLKNGMKTSGIITPKGTGSQGALVEWGKDAVEQIQNYIRSFNQGAGNAGNVLILSKQAEVQGLSQSNKDMDFLGLLNISRESIYNLYKIPLPLIMSNAMTLDNYKVAQKSFYTNAVLPVFDDLADGITHCLSNRINMHGMSLACSEVDIRNLQEVITDNMVAMKNTESATVNEVRAIGGLEPDPEGDEILVSAAKVPLSMLGSPSFGDTQIDESEDDETESGDGSSPSEEISGE